MSINFFNEIEKLVGDCEYAATVTFVGNDGTASTGLMLLTLVHKGKGYALINNNQQGEGYKINGTGKNTTVNITDNTTGRWYNAEAVYDIKIF